MTIKVLLFSVLRPLGGGDSVKVEVAAGATVLDLLDRLYRDHPALKDWDDKVRVAVDLDYVERDHVLTEGCEVAVMPPVQGG